MDKSNIQYSNFVNVRRCWVHHAPFSGIQGAWADNIHIEDCLLTDNCKGSAATNQNGSGISLYQSSNIGTNAGFHHIIRRCVLFNNEARNNVEGQGRPTDGNGIIMDVNNATGYNKQILIENNLVVKNGGRGIHVFNSSNATVRNNTCYHNNYVLDQHNHYIGEIQIEGSGCSVYNNIAIADPSLSTHSRAVKFYVACTNSNNILFGTTEGTIGANTQIITNVGLLKFVSPTYDPSTANFEVLTGSIAIDNGYNSNAPQDDLDEKSRPATGVVDIGCYEFNGQPSVVGPSLLLAPQTERLSSVRFFSLDGRLLGNGSVSESDNRQSSGMYLIRNAFNQNMKRIIR